MTNSGVDEYYSFDIKDEMLKISGKSEAKDKAWILVTINNKETGKNYTEDASRRNSEGEYDFRVSVASLPKGEYYVDLYGNDEKYHTYSGIVNSTLILKTTDSDAYFMPSPVYGTNQRIYKGDQVEPEDEDISLVTRADKETLERVKTLAVEITKDSSSDYEKALAIHDWVADYLYYDIAFLNDEKKETNIFSKDVLDNKFAVCSGYSNLTKDLLSAAGIPCKIVFGYALGISEKRGLVASESQQAEIEPRMERGVYRRPLGHPRYHLGLHQYL